MKYLFLSFFSLMFSLSLMAQGGNNAVKESLRLSNLARAKAQNCGGVPMAATHPLTWSPELAQAAKLQADYLATLPGAQLSHTGPAGLAHFSDRTRAANYQGSPAGENALWSSWLMDPVSSWIASGGHCRNLMSPNVDEVGIAYSSSPGGYFWIMVVGKKSQPRVAASQPTAPTAQALRTSESTQTLTVNNESWSKKYISLLNDFRQQGKTCGNKTGPSLLPVELDKDSNEVSKNVYENIQKRGTQDGTVSDVDSPSGTFISVGTIGAYGFEDYVKDPSEALRQDLKSPDICEILMSRQPRIGLHISVETDENKEEIILYISAIRK